MTETCGALRPPTWGVSIAARDARDQQTDDGWQRRAYLVSAPGDGPPDEPVWLPPDPRPDRESLEIGGPGPDVVQIPDELDPGSYRICTVAGVENICTGITVNA